ncbi:MAG: sigma 54-interacting transcriptional regulator, partial [Acidobacteria bacterium]|nr:sigma 54-interacting transcriptional regulator [Acidobacteriota bacterium]
MAYRLLLETHPTPLRFVLGEGTSVLGSASSSGADLEVVHPSVSRSHARFTVDGGRITLEDLGSSNGTWVDGKKIRQATALEEGQALRFGSVEGRLEALSEGDAEAAVELPLLRAPSAADPESGLSTAALAPAQAFLVAELPGLLARMARGGTFLEQTRWVGTALFRSMPCLEVEIASGRTVLFHGRREEGRPGESFTAEAEGGGVRILLTFFQRGVARASGPALEAAARLLDLSRRLQEGSRGERRDGGADALPAEGDLRMPEPPSLHPGVQEIYARARRIARGSIGVLIRGESGTGKEVLARYLHEASGVAGPFVALNCAALPADLLEAELFGIERGVATGVEARAGKFETAHSGTLFLDEIGDMAPSTQAKILRALQEGEVHRLGGKAPRPARARVLAATHRDLEAMLASGDFRSDLYHRIAGWEVTLPPLRHRRVDIPSLATHFLVREAEKLGVRPAGISRDALAALTAYAWPGNIRPRSTL